MREVLLVSGAWLRSFKLAQTLLIMLLFLTSSAFAQVDKEFWFSIPHSSINHGITSPLEVGGQPLYLRVATLGYPATIEVSVPASLKTSSPFIPLKVTLPANTAYTFDLTSFKDVLTLSNYGGFGVKSGGTLERDRAKGILIKSSDFITAYLELATPPNPEIYSLKGSSGLGTEFYASFQTRWPNHTVHNTENNDYSDKNGKFLAADSAFSSIDIVASQDGTIVTIVPTTDIIGHKKGIPFSVTLDRGEVYSARAISQGAVNASLGTGITKSTENLSGTHITSNKKIVVSLRDDSVYPYEFTNDGEYKNVNCEDYVGDQTVPVDMIGTEYIIMKGELSQNGMKDHYFVTGTKNGTTFTVSSDGATPISYSINAGQTIDITLNGNYDYVNSSANVYVFHLTGYKCEMSGAVLPSLNRCTGSDQVSFVRTYGEVGENFVMNVLVRSGGEGDFLLDGKQNSDISGFSTVSPDWKIKKIDFSIISKLSLGAHVLSNTSTYFHMGFINSTTKYSPGNLVGANYGYFSNYDTVKTKISIVNNNSDRIKIYNCLSSATDIRLKGEGGRTYTWSAYKYDSITKVWSALPTTDNYYFKTGTYTLSAAGIQGERPVVLKSIPLGQYMYIADIKSKAACNSDIKDTVWFTVLPCVDFRDTTDCICEDTPGSGTGSCYNLKNIEGLLVSSEYSSDFSVSGWYVKKPASQQIFDNFDGVTTVYYGTPSKGTFVAPLANPKTVGNVSAKVGMFSDVKDTTSTYIPVMMLDGSAINLKEGSVFTMKSACQSGEDWGGTISVAMALSGPNGMIRAPFQDFSLNGLSITDWKTLVFDFSAYDKVSYNQMFLVVKTSNWFPKKVYFDDFQRQQSAHLQVLTDVACHTIHDKDTVLAIVKSNDVSSNFADTVNVSYVVNAAANSCPVKDYLALPICATNGSCAQGVDLTKYTYKVGGSATANKVWYYDQALSQIVTDPKKATICAGADGTAKVYVDIQDKCSNHAAMVTIPINSLPTVRANPTASICSDAGKLTGWAKLDDFKSNVTTDATASVHWFSDIQMTKLIDGKKSVEVANKSVFYAKVYTTDTSCYLGKGLTFTVKSTPKSDFAPVSVCSNKLPFTLTASPIGQFIGDCVVNGQIPASTAVGTCTVKHIVTQSGCSDTATAIVTINDIPQIAVALHDAIEYKTSTTLSNVTFSGADSYSWTAASLLVNANVKTPTTVLLDKTTSFTVTATNTATTCSNTATTVVPVNNVPFNPIIKTVNNCLGKTFSASIGDAGGYRPYTYSWSVSGSSDVSTDSIFNFVPKTVGTVTVTLSATDSKGTNKIVTAQVEVYKQPILHSPNTITSCFGVATPVNIPFDAEGTAAYSFNWLGSNANNIVSSQTSNPTTLKTAIEIGSYPIELQVTDANGCSNTVPVTVLIKGNPTIAIDPSFVICAGQTKVINSTVAGNGTPDYHFKWEKASGASATPDPLVDAMVQNPTFKATGTNSYTLKVTVTDANGCIGTAVSSKIDVNANPKIKSVDGDWKSSYCANAGSVPLSACLETNGSPLYTHSWYIDNVKQDVTTPGTAVCSQMIFPVLPDKTSQTVKYVLMDSKQCGDSVVRKITINPIPEFSFIVNPNPVCQNDTALVKIISKFNNLTYTFGGTATSQMDTAKRIFIARNYGDFGLSVTAENTFKCRDEQETTVRVNKAPVVTLTDMDICRNTSKKIEPKIETTRSIANSSWKLDVTALSSTSEVSPTFTATDASNPLYKLQLTVVDDLGCDGSASMNVNVHDNPVAKIDAGESSRFEVADKEFTMVGTASGGTPTYTYEWQSASDLTSAANIATVTSKLAVDNSRSFNFIVTDKYKCTDIAKIFINIEGAPNVKVDPLPLCEGVDGVLVADVMSGSVNSEFTYTWYKKNGTAWDLVRTHSDNKTRRDTLNIIASTTSEYKVEVKTVAGKILFEPISTTAAVTVNPAPKITVNDGKKVTLCLNTEVKLEAKAVNPAMDYKIVWPDNGLEFPNPLTFRGVDSGDFKRIVVATDKVSLCETKLEVPIHVNPLPNITAKADDNEICTAVNNTLKATAAPVAAVYSYRWILNNDTVSQAKDYSYMSPEPIADKAVNYNYVLYVKNIETGCVQTTPLTVLVKSKPDPLVLPNVCTGKAMAIPVPLNAKVEWTDDSKKYLDLNDQLPKIITNIDGLLTLSYKLTETGNEYCPLSKQASIVVGKTPTLALSDQTVCQNKSALFAVSPTETGVKYDWNVDNVIFKTNVSNVSIPTSVAGSQIITLIGTNGNCINSTHAKLYVNGNPEVKLTIVDGDKDYPAQEVVHLQAVVPTYQNVGLNLIKWEAADELDKKDEVPSGFVYNATTKPLDVTTTYTFSVRDNNQCENSGSVTVRRLGAAVVELFHLISRPPVVDSLHPFEILSGNSPNYEIKKYKPTEIEIIESLIVCDKFTIGIGVNSANIDKFDYSWKRYINGEKDPNYVDLNLPIIDGEILTDDIYTYECIAKYKNYNTSLPPKRIDIRKVKFPNLGNLIITPSDPVDAMVYENTPLTLTVSGIQNLTDEKAFRALYTPKWTSKQDSLFTKKEWKQASVDSLGELSVYTYTINSTIIPSCSISVSASLPVKPRYMIPFKVRSTCVGVEQEVCVDSKYWGVMQRAYTWKFVPADAVVKGESSATCLKFTANKRYKKVHIYVEEVDFEKHRENTITYPNRDSFEIYPEFKIEKIAGKQDVCVGESDKYKLVYTKDSVERLAIANWAVRKYPHKDSTIVRGKMTDSSFSDCDVHWLSAGQNEVYAHSSYAPGYRCVDSAKLPVRIHDVVTPAFIHTPITPIFSGTEVNFTNLTFGSVDKRVIDTTNLAFYWDFVGDGVYAAERFEPVYSYDHWGIFDVHLMAEDKRWGCKRVVSDTLEVKKNWDCEIIFPNTFMPEAEKDKVFHSAKEKGILETDFSLRIYNRWGQLLWETHDKYASWDGVYQGAVSKQDVYVYHCQATCENGEVKNIKGDVTLLK